MAIVHEEFWLHRPESRFDDATEARLEPVRPLAKLEVKPGDFPFLDQVRGHDNDLVAERAAADPFGFPWL